MPCGRSFATPKTFNVFGLIAVEKSPLKGGHALLKESAVVCGNGPIIMRSQGPLPTIAFLHIMIAFAYSWLYHRSRMWHYNITKNLPSSGKAHYPTGPGPNECGNSRLHLMRACEDSLRRLQTDYIDLYQRRHAWPICMSAVSVRAVSRRYLGMVHFG